MNSSKLLWVVIILTVIILGAGICGKVLVDKIADKVIQKLQKDYSPSPYGPGIDPDKLDSEKLNTVNTTTPFKAIQPDNSENWNDSWEKHRR